MRTNGIITTLAASISMIAFAAPAQAQQRPFDIPAGSLKSALDSYGRQSGRPVIYRSDEVRGATSNGFKGSATPDAALEGILAGSGFRSQAGAGASVAIVRNVPLSSAVTREGEAGGRPDTPEDADQITVTGSRIRGAQVTSQVIVQTQQNAREQGQNTLTDIINNIPQNFGGGTNPGINIANVPESRGSGLGGGAALNLRGLGSDATLTLLNGHRLTYGAANQGIDVSAIPFLALDRIEIVADGSSALYGSDAVGGVANVILKRDYDGIATNARFSASTDGGNEQQQYGAIAGMKWSDGGFMATYEFERRTPIEARQRDYAAIPARGLDLYPAQKRHSMVVAGHQKLLAGVSLRIDALYNHRDTLSRMPLGTAGDPQINGQFYRYKTETVSVSPSVLIEIGNDWAASAIGSYGRENLQYGTDLMRNGVSTPLSRACYCNTSKSFELNADGPLFQLPGGKARLAVGAGYRSNGFHAFRTLGTPQDIKADQDVYFGFGEISLPVISPANNVAFVDRLNLSAAMRYERYNDYDVATPKFGLIYAPSPDLELRGSWGKSFKAPTLYQQFSVPFIYLDPPSYYNVSTYPADAAILSINGGNPSLRPERATNWTASIVLHPRVMPGLEVEANYFNVRYRDRVTYPITFARQALTNSEYARYVNFAPTVQQAREAEALTSLFYNYTSFPFDPAKVGAIIDNRSTNVAQQNVQGLDLGLRYVHNLYDAGTLNLSINASYVEIQQRLNALAPFVKLAGTAFSPPQFRLRGGVTWKNDSTSVSTFVNHQDSVDDARATQVIPGRPFTTIDLAVRHEVHSGPRIFRGLEMIFSMTNLLNAKPPLLVTTQLNQAPYDSTNYSPFGRVIGVNLIKKW